VLATPDEPPGVPISEPDPVAIVYTSATTGLPKGATYTHERLEAIRRIEATSEPDLRPRTVAAIPLAHMGFMARIAANIDRLGCTVLMDRWSARAHLELIELEHLTLLGGIPTQLQLMLMDPAFGRYDLSSLRSCAMGGAPVSPAQVRQIREGFGVPVTVRYSCTELGLATGTRRGDPDVVVAETVGRPLPEVDLRITDPDAHGIGEIAIRSPAMMTGYWRDPNGTRAAFDDDGYFHTGDLGFLDPERNLRLSGRTKEMYIRGGYNVYPVEVEAVLREHPNVSLAAVIGIPDTVLGERGLAFVVPRSVEQPPTEDELRAFVADRIADYKAPDVIEIRESLPMTALYKVDKSALMRESVRRT
jgi:acyl-CoA synthetase (AMP-forming)/AMP-acid ligase II